MNLKNIILEKLNPNPSYKIPSFEEIDKRFVPGSKSHFENLIHKHNDHSDRENILYHNRHNLNDLQKQAWAHHSKAIKDTSAHFLLHYGHLVDEKDKTDFKLGYFNTEDPSSMARYWLQD